MAYIIGLLTPEEEAELERRGWELEDPPAELVPSEDDNDRRNFGVAVADRKRMRMAWVDISMFDAMDGPDWDKGGGAADEDGTVTCASCGDRCDAKTAHRHQETFIGDECCWDERLRTTE